MGGRGFCESPVCSRVARTERGYGATGAQALLGKSARVGALRGRTVQLENGLPALVTIHPSAVLRAGEDRDARRADLLEDLSRARDLLSELRRGPDRGVLSPESPSRERVGLFGASQTSKSAKS